MSTFDEELLVQFTSVTGVEDLQIAQKYLEFSSGDLSSAITLYFESGGQTQTSHSFTTTHPQDSSSFPGFSNSAEFSNHSSTNHMEDELLAQQLSHDFLQNRTSNSAPIDVERFSETASLHNSSPEQNMAPSVPPISEIFADTPEVLSHTPDNFRTGSRRDVFMVDRAQPYIYQEASREDFRSSVPRRYDTALNSGYSRLQRACSGLVTNLSLNEARRRAKHLNKFVLVTLIDLGESDSMTGLIDLFSGKKQQELLKEKFLVVQYESDTPAGQEYTNFYPVRNFPHIAIIDPRTGERLKCWTRINRTLITSTLMHFLNRNSLTGKLEYPDVEPLPPKDVREMSEQEQIDAAIQASLNASKFQVGSSSNHVPLVSIVDSDSDGAEFILDSEEEQEEEEEEKTQLSPLQLISSAPALDIPDPAPGTPSTRIQFRLPDNSRLVKAMSKDTKVIALFQFIKLHIPSDAHEIEMICVGKSINEKVELTVTDAGLENSVIIVTYIDQ